MIINDAIRKFLSKMQIKVNINRTLKKKFGNFLFRYFLIILRSIALNLFYRRILPYFIIDRFIITHNVSRIDNNYTYNANLKNSVIVNIVVILDISKYQI